MKNRIDVNLEQLSTDELHHLADRIHELIEARKLAEAIAVDVVPPAKRAKRAKAAKRNSGEFIDIKIVKGHAYRYRRYWENGTLRSEYLGKA